MEEERPPATAQHDRQSVSSGRVPQESTGSCIQETGPRRHLGESPNGTSWKAALDGAAPGSSTARSGLSSVPISTSTAPAKCTCAPKSQLRCSACSSLHSLRWRGCAHACANQDETIWTGRCPLKTCVPLKAKNTLTGPAQCPSVQQYNTPTPTSICL